jgi:hypothetical protein
MAGAILALLGGKAKSSQKHPIICGLYPLIKDFSLSGIVISSILRLVLFVQGFFDGI